MQSYRFALLALLALTACDRPKEPDARQLASHALRGVLKYPGSAIVSIAAGTDAAEVRLTSTAAVSAVADWYREALRLNGWQLKNEGTAPDGTATIYAEKETQPLWITLRPGDGGGTSYTLIGAVPDSTAAKPN
jgi:hypothetical protein